MAANGGGDSRTEAVRFRRPDLVSDIIRLQLQDSNIDKVSVICQDGVTMGLSRILLASFSPYLSALMRHNQLDAGEDSTVIIPNLDAESFKHLFKSMIEKDNISAEALSLFDGILWERHHWDHRFVRTDQQQLHITTTTTAEEVLLRGENIKFETVKEMIKSEPEDEQILVEAWSSDLKEKELSYSEQDSVIVNKAVRPNRRKRKVHVTKEISDVDCDEESESSDDIQFKKKKVGRRRKTNPKNTDENLTNGISHKDRKKNNAKNQRIEKISLTPDCDLLQDKSFVDIQEKLKKDLEDVDNLADPCLLWHQYHGLDPNIYDLKHQVKQPPLVCPICNIHIATTGEEKHGIGLVSFSLHLRGHKYAKFRCGCVPGPGHKTDHLKLVHWNWKQCQECSKIVEPSRLPFHMLTDHKHPLKCSICNKKLSANSYRAHMDKHLQKKPSCGCDILFKGEEHREHHMQVKHVKEKLGCNKCYFLCSNKTELSAHKQEKHKNQPSEHSRVFCDLCGKATTRCLAFHKKLFHDPVLFDCQFCPKRFNEAKMRIHIRRCHNERICTICGAKVKDLLLHTRNKHTPVEQLNFKCELCPKGFTYKAVLDRHMMNIHLKERPHKCRYGCGAAYNCSSNRNGHERKKHGQVFTSLPNQEFPVPPDQMSGV